MNVVGGKVCYEAVGNRCRSPAMQLCRNSICPEIYFLMQAMDTDNSGTITADELKEAMQKQGSPLVQEELTRLLTSIDVDSTGR